MFLFFSEVIVGFALPDRPSHPGFFRFLVYQLTVAPIVLHHASCLVPSFSEPAYLIPGKSPRLKDLTEKMTQAGS